MDHNPPTAADLAWSAANDAQRMNRELLHRVGVLEYMVNDLQRRVRELEAKAWNQ